MHGLGTECGSSRFDLASLVSLTTIHVVSPDLAFSQELLILDAVLVNDVIITTGNEGTLVLKNLETPGLSVEVGSLNELFIGSIDVDSLNLTIVMSNSNLAVQNVNSRSKVILFKCNLSQELIFALVA
jgi:hypothetical protein